MGGIGAYWNFFRRFRKFGKVLGNFRAFLDVLGRFETRKEV